MTKFVKGIFDRILNSETPEIGQFNEMFKITSFSMSVGMIYPNPTTDKYRLMAIPFIFVTSSPPMILLMLNIYEEYIKGNLLLVLKHGAMALPFFLGFGKNILIYYKRAEAQWILDLINRDYAAFNHTTEKYKKIVQANIRSSRSYILAWNSCVMSVFTAFVFSAAVMNIISSLFMSEPKKYMIYDIYLPNKDPESRFDSPYFEIMFMYLLYVSVVFAICYTGYDGFMMVAINHACLRLAIFNRHVEDAMLFKGEALRSRMTSAIKEQIETLHLIDIIQDTFNNYLGLMYCGVMVETVICLYLMKEGYDFDFQFTCVSIHTVLHIYVPCMITDKLKTKSELSAVELYCSGWEGTRDLSVRRYLPYMIARAQCPVALKAFGIFTYEMELFVSIMKTAYSLYTLIKTQQT